MDNEINPRGMRKESHSFPIVNLSSESLKEAFFVPKRPVENKKNNNSSYEQESISTPNRTTESSTRNSSNNNTKEEICSSNHQNEYTFYSEMNRDSERISQCHSTQINKFNVDENQSEQNGLSRIYLDNANHYKRCDYQLIYVPPFSPFIDNNKYNIKNEEEMKNHSNIKRISSMKNPFSLPSSQSIANVNLDNTEILSVNIKINTNEILIFKLNRFDDLFHTVKLFCEINKLNDKFIKPLILRSLQALNQVYQVMNYSFSSEDKLRLELIENYYVDTEFN